MPEELQYQFGVTLTLLILYSIIRYFSSRIINRHASGTLVTASRVRFVTRFLNLVWLAVFLTFIGITWDISLQGLALYFTSFFAVAGIALFASWSILSNITASAILFFYFPYRVGTRVRIIDGDNSVEGTVSDITLFSIKIDTAEGDQVSYPNNLAIQKPIINYRDNPINPGNDEHQAED